MGIDASAAGMADASRRAARRGPATALFLAAGAESLGDSPLAGRADLVTVTMPWGSLLHGILGLDPATAPALAGVAATLRPGARLEVLVSVVPSDRIRSLDRLTLAHRPIVADAWLAADLRLDRMLPATRDDLLASGSSWARRLTAGGRSGARPVWRLTASRGGTG